MSGFQKKSSGGSAINWKFPTSNVTDAKKGAYNFKGITANTSITLNPNAKIGDEWEIANTDFSIEDGVKDVIVGLATDSFQNASGTYTTGELIINASNSHLKIIKSGNTQYDVVFDGAVTESQTANVKSAGDWNANTNTPDLNQPLNRIDEDGNFLLYRVSVEGTQDLGQGNDDFKENDTIRWWTVTTYRKDVLDSNKYDNGSPWDATKTDYLSGQNFTYTPVNDIQTTNGLIKAGTTYLLTYDTDNVLPALGVPSPNNLVIVNRDNATFVKYGTTAEKLALGVVPSSTPFFDTDLGKLQYYKTSSDVFTVNKAATDLPYLVEWASVNSVFSNMQFKITTSLTETTDNSVINLPDGQDVLLYIIGRQFFNGAQAGNTLGGAFTVRNDNGNLTLVSIEPNRYWGGGLDYTTMSYADFPNLVTSPIGISISDVNTIFANIAGAGIWTNLDGTLTQSQSLEDFKPLTAYATGERFVAPMPVNADFISNNGAIVNVDYIFEANTDIPNTIAAFDEAQADSGNYDLVGVFRTSGTQDRVLTGTGIMLLDPLADLSNTGISEYIHWTTTDTPKTIRLVPAPAFVNIWKDYTGTNIAQPTAANEDFILPADSQMWVHRAGNNVYITFESNEGGATGETFATVASNEIGTLKQVANVKEDGIAKINQDYVDAGLLPLVNGYTLTNGAIDNPKFALMFPTFVSGNDLTVPSTFNGKFVRNLGGNAGAFMSSQADATAPNSLRLRTSSAAGGNSFGATHSMFTNTGNTTSQGSVQLQGDNETRPENFAMQFCLVLDSYSRVLMVDPDLVPIAQQVIGTALVEERGIFKEIHDDIAGGTTGTITFPDGGFASIPKVIATAETNGHNINVRNPTTTGFTYDQWDVEDVQQGGNFTYYAKGLK